jgi:hypothetical protein
MNKKVSVITISIFIFLLLSACKSTDSKEADQSRIYVYSLEANWDRIEAQALTWHSDAYLTKVILPILMDAPLPGEMLLHAYFYSNSDSKEILELMIDPAEDQIHTKIYPLVQPLADVSIVRNNWKIDSVDALKLLMNESDYEALLSSDTQCSSLTLEKRLGTHGPSTVWRILVQDCGISNYLRNGYINAMTGEPIN